MRYGIEHTFGSGEGDEDTVSDIDRLRLRVSAVEDKVARLTDDGVTTRAIAALADRDVAEFRTVMRGHTGVLNALRQTQIEQDEALRVVRETLDEQGGALRVVRETLDEQGEALHTLVAGQTAILQHLGIAEEGSGAQGPARGG